MSNNPYDSYDPSGTLLDADIFLISRAPHSGATTFKTQMTGVLNYISSKSANNTVYQSYESGIDAVTSGSILVPYKTAAYAMSQITAATATNLYTLVTLGGYSNETAQIVTKPYVNWLGQTQGTIINNSLPVILDVASWNANPNGYMYRSFLTFNGDIHDDFSTLTNVTPAGGFIQNNTIYVVGNYIVNGNINNFPFMYNYQSYFDVVTIDNSDLLSDNNYYFSLTLGSSSSVNSASSGLTSDEIITFIQRAPSSGAIVNTSTITGALPISSLTSDGINSTVSYDSSSVYGITPTSTNGGKLVLLDNLNSIDTSITGAGYSEITLNDVNQTLTNPCPNYLVVDGDGNANLFLPPMNLSNSLNSKKNHLMVVIGNTFTNWDLATNTGAQTLTVKPNDRYLVFITSNGSADGSFVAISLGNNTGINHGDLTTSAVFNAPNSTGMFLTAGSPSTPQNVALTPADVSNPGVLIPTGVQFLGGSKVFSGDISAPNLSVASNFGDFTASAIDGGPPSPTGMNITIGNSLTPQNVSLCSATVGEPGLVNTGAQSFGGVKTFTSAPNLSSLNAFSVLYLDGSKNVSASTNFIYNSSGQLILTDQGDGNLLLLNNQNGSAVANQMGFQNNGTLRFSVGHNNSADQSYIFSSSTVLKFGTSSAEVARFSGSNLGLGVTAPDFLLEFPTTTGSKICLWKGAANQHQIFGFNINSAELNYQVNTTGSNHVFKAGTSSTTSNELMRINGNGQVSIGTSTPDASIILQVDSTVQAFAPPRMTTTQKNAISSPLEGSIVYDVTLHKLCVRGAASWETITSI